MSLTIPGLFALATITVGSWVTPQTPSTEDSIRIASLPRAVGVVRLREDLIDRDWTGRARFLRIRLTVRVDRPGSTFFLFHNPGLIWTQGPRVAGKSIAEAIETKYRDRKETWQSIQYDARAVPSDAADNLELDFVFSGREIRRSGCDGPYRVLVDVAPYDPALIRLLRMSASYPMPAAVRRIELDTHAWRRGRFRD